MDHILKGFQFHRELNPNSSLRLARSLHDRTPTTSYRIHTPPLCSSPVATPQTSQLIPAPRTFVCALPSAWKAFPPDFQTANTCWSSGASSNVSFLVRVSWPPKELPRYHPIFLFSIVCITIWNIFLLINAIWGGVNRPTGWTRDERKDPPTLFQAMSSASRTCLSWTLVGAQ